MTQAAIETPIDGRVTRAQARRESRRALILRAAVETFSARGYHSTRVADIIKAAGIARGTFYLYFESKNAIFLELLDTLLDEFLGGIEGVEAEVPTAQREIVMFQRSQGKLGAKLGKTTGWIHRASMKRMASLT